jgi:hypothetical protein
VKIRKTKIGHEVLILLLYLISSPFMFGILYPENITGDGGMIYLVIISISAITIMISVIVISSLKLLKNVEKIEILYGLIPLTISYLIFFIGFSDAHLDIRNTFYASNGLVLIGLYLGSIRYKFKV